jgi:hypothetical protein
MPPPKTSRERDPEHALSGVKRSRRALVGETAGPVSGPKRYIGETLKIFETFRASNSMVVWVEPREHPSRPGMVGGILFFDFINLHPVRNRKTPRRR